MTWNKFIYLEFSFNIIKLGCFVIHLTPIKIELTSIPIQHVIKRFLTKEISTVVHYLSLSDDLEACQL